MKLPILREEVVPLQSAEVACSKVKEDTSVTTKVIFPQVKPSQVIFVQVQVIFVTSLVFLSATLEDVFLVALTAFILFLFL